MWSLESKLQIANLIGHDLLILRPLSFYKNWNCLSFAGFLMLVHVFQVFVHLVKLTYIHAQLNTLRMSLYNYIFDLLG